jgi:hypothetical protein
MHYQEAVFPKLFDYTELWQHEAPAWWDRYVGNNENKPVGYDLFARLGKPTIIKTETTTRAVTRWTPPTQPNKPVTVNGGSVGEAQRAFAAFLGAGMLDDDETEQWKQLGYPSRPWWAGRSMQELQDSGYIWDEDKMTYVWGGRRTTPNEPIILSESRLFNARKAAERGLHWSKDGRLDLADENWDVDWEELLEKEVGTEVAAKVANFDLFSDDDYDYAIDHPSVAGSAEHWVDLLMNIMTQASGLLSDLGLSVTVGVEAKSTEAPTEALLPDDTITREEFHHGIH